MKLPVKLRFRFLLIVFSMTFWIIFFAGISSFANPRGSIEVFNAAALMQQEPGGVLTGGEGAPEDFMFEEEPAGKTVIMPLVLNKLRYDAESLLEESGIEKWQVVDVASGKQENSVVRQKPAAGIPVSPEGQGIILYIVAPGRSSPSASVGDKPAPGKTRPSAVPFWSIFGLSQVVVFAGLAFLVNRFKTRKSAARAMKMTPRKLHGPEREKPVIIVEKIEKSPGAPPATASPGEKIAADSVREPAGREKKRVSDSVAKMIIEFATPQEKATSKKAEGKPAPGADEGAKEDALPS